MVIMGTNRGASFSGWNTDAGLAYTAELPGQLRGAISKVRHMSFNSCAVSVLEHTYAILAGCSAPGTCRTSS